MKFSTLKFYIVKHVIPMTLPMLSKENYRMTKNYEEAHAEIIEIRNERTAQFFGLEWPGRPFLHISRGVGGYDLLDYLFDWVDMLVYILSGEYSNDICRAADDRLLRYAY